MTTKGIFKALVFFTMLALPMTASIPQAMAVEEQTAFENNLQKLTPAQLEELQKKVAEFQVQGDAQAMTLEEIRAQYVAFIEKTVGEMSR